MGVASAANLITDRNALKSLFGTSENTVGGVAIDVIRDESITDDYTVSEHPVEAGIDVTDARIKKPQVVRLECTITDDLTDVSIGAIKSVVKGGLQTWRDKLAKLEAVKESNDPITVVTPFRTYTSMVITTMNVTQTPETSQALVFTLELKYIRRVKSLLTTVDESSIPKRKKDKKTDTNAGAQDKAGKTAAKGTKSTTQVDRSFLADLVGVGG